MQCDSFYPGLHSTLDFGDTCYVNMNKDNYTSFCTGEPTILCAIGRGGTCTLDRRISDNEDS